MSVDQAAVNAKVQDILEDLITAIEALDIDINPDVKTATDAATTKDGELTVLLAA